MHDVGVTLDEHEPVHLDRAELADAAHVVAAQIDQHHVLGALLFVVDHLIGECLVFILGCAARAGSGDGPVLDLALMDAHQQLWRRAGQLKGLRSGSFQLF